MLYEVITFLIYQNGEACIACPLVCTEGMGAILERFADRPETQEILRHVRDGIDGEFTIGAQFLSEIQGGVITSLAYIIRSYTKRLGVPSGVQAGDRGFPAATRFLAPATPG